MRDKTLHESRKRYVLIVADLDHLQIRTKFSLKLLWLTVQSRVVAKTLFCPGYLAGFSAVEGSMRVDCEWQPDEVLETDPTSLEQ